MVLFVVTLTVMLVAVLGMSLGVVLTGRRLRGSCGGLTSGSCACKEQGLETCTRKTSNPSSRLKAIGGLRPPS